MPSCFYDDLRRRGTRNRDTNEKHGQLPIFYLEYEPMTRDSPVLSRSGRMCALRRYFTGGTPVPLCFCHLFPLLVADYTTPLRPNEQRKMFGCATSLCLRARFNSRRGAAPALPRFSIGRPPWTAQACLQRPTGVAAWGGRCRVREQAPSAKAAASHRTPERFPRNIQRSRGQRKLACGLLLCRWLLIP